MTCHHLIGAVLGLGALATVPVLADGYPDRPVSVMVGYGAGGATDFQARIVTMMSADEDHLGQPMVIVNRPGAGGRVGWNWFADAADADGYTLAAYNVPHFIAQSIEGGVGYGTSSFEPIANWGVDPAVVAVPTGSPYRTVGDLMAHAADNPGKVTLSGAGLYVGHHIAALQLEKATGATLSYVPSDGGGAAAMKAIVAGDVVAGINNLSDAFRAQEAGEVRILAVADLERSEFLPDVPTLMESGIDVDDASVNFRGVMVPAGTPPEVIDFLAAKVPAMFADAHVVRQMRTNGSPMRIMDRDEVIELWNVRRGVLETLLTGLKRDGR